MAQHSATEQYLLELINAERTKAGVQPLAFDNDLSESAEGHSKWMLAADVFSHTGSGGSSPTARMKAAGYTLQGSWATGENIAWATTRAPTGYADEVQLLHTNLMNSSGHRANLLNGNFREVGLGFEVGDYRGRSSAFVTENFAKTGTDLFLTGVAFDDKDGDRFYDPGEGLGGIAVTAKTASGVTYQTTTSAAGGYDVALKAGTYTVTFSGPGIASTTQSVTIGTKNVKRDLIDPDASSGTAVAAASAPEAESSQPAPTQPAQPTGNTAPSHNAPSNTWLADFFGRHGAESRTLAWHEEQGSGGQGSGPSQAHAKFALAGDSLAFQASRKVQADLGEAGDRIGDVADGLAGRIADLWGSNDLPHVGAKVAGHAEMHGDVDGGANAIVAKLLAHFSAGQAGVNSDLAV